jgi:hypothetical protein
MWARLGAPSLPGGHRGSSERTLIEADFGVPATARAGARHSEMIWRRGQDQAYRTDSAEQPGEPLVSLLGSASARETSWPGGPRERGRTVISFVVRGTRHGQDLDPVAKLVSGVVPSARGREGPSFAAADTYARWRNRFNWKPGRLRLGVLHDRVGARGRRPRCAFRDLKRAGKPAHARGGRTPLLIDTGRPVCHTQGAALMDELTKVTRVCRLAGRQARPTETLLVLRRDGGPERGMQQGGRCSPQAVQPTGIIVTKPRWNRQGWLPSWPFAAS